MHLRLDQLIAVPAATATLLLSADACPQSSAPGECALQLAPLTFEANRGQLDPTIRFAGRGRAQRFLVGDNALSFALAEGVRLELSLGKPTALLGEERLTTRSHYLRGADPAAWITGVPHFARVRAVEAWPGVDLVLREAEGRLEILLELAAGTDPSAVVIEIGGVEELSVDADGALRLAGGDGSVTLAPPVAWQEDGAERRDVAVRYDARGGTSFGFVAPDRDPTLPLSIDPVLVYSTYVGGSGYDDVNAVAAGPAGALYVAGTTTSPGLAGPGTGPSGGRDAFVAKLESDGSTLQWITYLGGAFAGGLYEEAVFDVAVDAEGRAVVCGATNSPNFPTPAAAQPAHAGADDGFVAKLQSDGASLVWSTYLGGASFDSARALVVAQDGSIIVVGGTASGNFPILAALQPFHGGKFDAFLARFHASGELLASTYLGSPDDDAASDVALDPAENVLVAGSAKDTGFFGRLSPDLGSLHYARSFPEAVAAIAADGNGRVFLGGSTKDQCLPTTFGSHQSSHSTSAGSVLTLVDTYLCRFDATGTVLEACTYHGSSTKDETLTGLAVTEAGDVFLSYISSVGGYSSTPIVGRLAALDSDLRNLVFSIVVGTDETTTSGVVLTPDGDLLVCGTTTNDEAFATPGVAQETFGGGWTDGWLRRYAPVATAVTGLSLTTPKVTHGASLAAVVTLDGLAPAGGVQVSITVDDPDLVAAPSSVLVPAGSASASFALDTALTANPQAVHVAATWNLSSASAELEVWHGPFYALADVIYEEPNPFAPLVAAGAIDGQDRIVGTLHGQAFVKEPGQPAQKIAGTSAGLDLQDGGAALVLLSGGGTGLYYGGVVVPVATLDGASAISSSGSICGSLIAPTAPWLDPAGAASFLLPKIEGGTANGKAFDVNASDWVVGFWKAETYDNRAFLYRPGQGSVSLGTLLGTGSSEAYAVNDAGHVVGWSHAPGAWVHGFLWDEASGMVDLPPLPLDVTARALGVSASGRVVGLSANKAVVWTEDLEPRELGAMLDPAVAFRKDFRKAVDVNDAGSVLVEGRLDSDNCGTGSVDAIFRFVPDGPSWNLYGQGWPGTAGIPSFSLSAPPVVCTTPILQIGNPTGSPTVGLLLVGNAPASSPTFLGPTQLVANPAFLPIALGTGGASLPASLPCAKAWQGEVLYLQAAILDPGASAGIAATVGMQVCLQ